MILVDYATAEDCKNPDAWELCLKCGECGRVFIFGIMCEEEDKWEQKQTGN